MSKYRFIDESRQHLHTLNGQPLKGNTTVLQVIAKNLTWWASECAAVECLESGEKIPTIREEYEKACASDDKKVAIDALQVKYPIFKKARFAHMKKRDKKADAGTDLHEILEDYINLCIKNNNGVPASIAVRDDTGKIGHFTNWAIKNVGKFILAESHCYSEKLWVGAIADLIYEDKKGSIVVLDFKSKAKAYKSDFLQLAGIDIMATENGLLNSEGELMFKIEKPIGAYVIFPFGAETSEPEFYYDTETAKKVYEQVVGLNNFINN